MIPGNGELRVPPGFRFHPTEEELLYYYLRKKVAYEAIDLDVIRDIDLNKLEPWDLKEKCRIGSGPQNEWYFFSHKDKKYPTGTRTNRATAAGFWKATGRDKAIHHSNSKRIGMRKTLVFYTGRAPHGQKTDWIMHEYRLQEDNYSELQEDGWVVCRVFMKKSHQKGHQSEIEEQFNHFNASGSGAPLDRSKHKFHDLQSEFSLDHSMHLPQLLSPELGVAPFLQPVCMNNNVEVECSQNMMNKLGGGGGGGSNNNIHHHQERPYNGDWSFLDKLLASHQSLDHHLISCHVKSNNPVSQALEIGSLVQRFPFQYAACQSEFMKCSK